MKKTTYFIILLLITSGIYAQNINTYKYIIVPKKFSVLKDTNQYQLNVLSRLLFKESGFTAIFDDQLPDDLQFNSCLGLKADLVENSGMFTTKLKITLQDCKNNIVFTSVEGKSRKKDYRQAHQEALRNTFKSMARLNYSYTPAVKPVTTKPVAEKKIQPIAEPVEKNLVAEGAKVLYAQAVTHGFQLVDSTPKVVYIIQRTNLDNFYIIKDRNGILYKKENNWIAEYYNGPVLVQKILTVKF